MLMSYEAGLHSLPKSSGGHAAAGLAPAGVGACHKRASQGHEIAAVIPVSFVFQKWMRAVGARVSIWRVVAESARATPEHSWAIKVVKDLGSAKVLLTLALAFLVCGSAIAARFWCAAGACFLDLRMSPKACSRPDRGWIPIRGQTRRRRSDAPAT
jgi:hypothetical protein